MCLILPPGVTACIIIRLATAAVSGAQQADMFGGLSLEAPAAGPSQTGHLDALMGLGSPQAPMQSPAAGASTDLFGGLSVGGQQLYVQEHPHIYHAYATAFVCAGNASAGQ